MFDKWDDDELDKLEEREEVKHESAEMVEAASVQRAFIEHGVRQGVVDPKVLSVVRDLFTSGKDVDALGVLANECGFVPSQQVSVDLTVAPRSRAMVGGNHATSEHVDIVILNNNGHPIRFRGWVEHKR